MLTVYRNSKCVDDLDECGYGARMPWKLRLREAPKAGERYEIGDCWVAIEHEGSFYKFSDSPPTWVPLVISAFYKRDHLGKRPPFLVVLPNRAVWCVDEPGYRKGKPHGSGWTVKGELPSITCSPSINYVGSYHGFIKAGVITDDCEGRKHGG